MEVGALDPATGAGLWNWVGTGSLAPASNSRSLTCDLHAVYLATQRGLYAFQPSTGHILRRALAGNDFSLIPPGFAG